MARRELDKAWSSAKKKKKNVREENLNHVNFKLCSCPRHQAKPKLTLVRSHG